MRRGGKGGAGPLGCLSFSEPDLQQSDYSGLFEALSFERSIEDMQFEGGVGVREDRWRFKQVTERWNRQRDPLCRELDLNGF